jgi:hypothetical protein
MNQFFEGLANQNNAEVTSVMTKDTSSLECSGYLTITKGVISIEVSYWAKTYAGFLGNLIKVDDIDWDTQASYISGVKIDSISKFNEGLKNMGLSTISTSLEISREEITNEVYKSISNSKIFKQVYKDAKLFESLSYDDARNALLNYAISNYESSSAWYLNKYGLSESGNTKPSLEELIKIKSGK